MTKGRKKRIVIWGAGGHGHVVADILGLLGSWDVTGFVDNVNPAGTFVMGVPVLGNRGILPRLRADGVAAMAVAIGNPEAHAALMEIAKGFDFEFPSFVHPFTSVSPSARIGDGCVVCAGAIVGPQAELKAGAIVNTNASLDHDVCVGFCTHIAPGAIVCGYTSIGDKCWIGTGAVICDHVSVGSLTTIGAGSTVLHNVPSAVTAYGVPAKIIKRNPYP